MRETDIKSTPSIIDRLIDLEPQASIETPKSRAKSLRELKQSVRRDLEWLLNTRHTADNIPPELEELNKSVAVYGLPDITTLSSKSYDDQKTLIRSVESALRLFEPRFMNLKVSLETADTAERNLKFRIQATLRVKPNPEPVVFDTILQVGNNEFAIKEG